MSRFFVGQRVRVARLIVPYGFSPALVGREGVVTEVHDLPAPTLYGLDIAPIWDDALYWYGLDADELEPILPEGAAPSEFESLRDLLDSLERVRA